MAENEAIIGIDPGPERSGYARLRPLILAGRPRPFLFELLDAGLIDNGDLITQLRVGLFGKAPVLAVERFEFQRAPVGRRTVDTIMFTGKIALVAEMKGYKIVWYKPSEWHRMLVGRRGSAKQAVLKRAIMDVFPATGDGANPEIGTKRKPGPLYLMRKTAGRHHWDALGLALCYLLAIQRGELGWTR